MDDYAVVLILDDTSFKSSLLRRKFSRQAEAFKKYCRKREEILETSSSRNISLIPLEFWRDCHVLHKFPSLLNKLILTHDDEFIFFFLRTKSFNDLDHLLSNVEGWHSKLSFIERAIQENHQIFIYLKGKIQENSSFLNVELSLFRLVQINPEIIRYLVKLDGFDDELLLNACKKNISLLRFIPYYRDFHMSVIEHCPQALKYSNYVLLNDEEVVLTAISKDKTCLQYASDSIIEKVLIGKELLEYSVEDIKTLVLSALRTKPSLFKYLPDSVKEDQEFVLKVVPHARVSIPKSLKQNRDFLMEWVKIDSKAFETCTDLELKSNRQFLLDSLGVYRHTLRDSPPHLKDDKEFVMECLKFNSNRLSEASDRLRDDEQVVTFSIMKCHFNFKHASDRLREDKEFVMKYIGDYPKIFELLSERLKRDREILLKVASVGALNSLENDFFADEEFVLEIVKNSPKVLSTIFSPDQLFIRKCVKRNGFSLYYLQVNQETEHKLAKKAALSSGYLSDKYEKRYMVNSWFQERIDLEYDGLYFSPSSPIFVKGFIKYV